MFDPVEILPAVSDVGVSLPLGLPLRSGLSGKRLETLLVEIQGLLFLISLVRPEDCHDDQLRMILTPNLLDTTSRGVENLPLSLGPAED